MEAQQEIRRNYCAFLKNGVYKVGYIGPCGDFHVLGDIRSFDTFEEANYVAIKVSQGCYGYKIGNHINMR